MSSPAIPLGGGIPSGADPEGGGIATGSPTGAKQYPGANVAIPVMGSDGMARTDRFVRGNPNRKNMDAVPVGARPYLRSMRPDSSSDIKAVAGNDAGAPPDPLAGVRDKRTMLRMLATPDMGDDGMARSGFALGNPQRQKNRDFSGPPRGIPPMLAAIQQLNGGNPQPQQYPTPTPMQTPDENTAPPVITTPSQSPLTQPTGVPTVDIPTNVPPPVVSSGSPILDGIRAFGKMIGF